MWAFAFLVPMGLAGLLNAPEWVSSAIILAYLISMLVFAPRLVRSRLKADDMKVAAAGEVSWGDELAR